jgi:membrane-anchored protein YejM (alkaline phosphatase superfamily)
MQEMVFGHSPRWIAKTGKEQLEYYDQYLLELLGALEQAGLADRSLLVVVSDHGDRADSANVENYRVPLFVTGRGVAPSRRSAHLSHCDLPAILGHFLAGQPLPEARTSLLTVGSTERWIYGEITSGGSYLFIENDTGAVLASDGTLAASSLHRRFQGQLDVFAARYSR